MPNRRYSYTGMGLIAAGLLLLVLRFTGFSLASILWPMWVLVPGALMLFGAFSSNKAQPGLAVPGAIVGGTGAILFLLNLSGQWESWAYLWTLYPVFIGGALAAVGRRNGNEGLQQKGEASVRSGLAMLAGFGLFFELVVFGGVNIIGSALIPILLIIGGAYLIYGPERVAFLPGMFEKPKRKRRLTDPDTGIDVDLRRRIDDAIYEDDRAQV